MLFASYPSPKSKSNRLWQKDKTLLVNVLTVTETIWKWMHWIRETIYYWHTVSCLQLVQTETREDKESFQKLPNFSFFHNFHDIHFDAAIHYFSLTPRMQSYTALYPSKCLESVGLKKVQLGLVLHSKKKATQKLNCFEQNVHSYLISL